MGMIIDGNAAAAALKRKISAAIEGMKAPPSLAIITVGNKDDASKVYVRNKMKAALSLGISAQHHIFTRLDYTSVNFYSQIKEIIGSNDGIILQLPVPEWCDADTILRLIPPEKDVDGLTIYQQGLLLHNPDQALKPCTPAAIISLLSAIGAEAGSGKNALVIGRSHLVGRPIAELLLQHNWTVTIVHSKTPKNELCNAFVNADLVIAAAGVPDLLTERDINNYLAIKKDRIIIDVSINRNKNNKLCGDFNEEFKDKFSKFYTPVPGGVGPMTVAQLMLNTYIAAKGDNSR